MKHGLKSFCKAVFVEALLLLMTVAITPISMAEEQPRYYTERGDKEILADAPWRVSSSTAPIPIEVVVKDAPYPDMQLVNIQTFDANTGGTVKTDLSVAGVRPGAYWHRIYSNLRASDFLKENNNINIKVVLNYRLYWKIGEGGVWTNHTFTQYLRVWVGSNLPSLPGWYGGDTHYHSEFSGDIHYDNPDANPDEVTEFGGNLIMTVNAAKAIGLDWTCVTDHAYYLDDGDTWDEYVQAVNNIRNNYGFNMILGEEVSPRTMDDEDCSLHLLVFGMSDYVVGDEHRHSSLDHSKNLREVLNNLHGGIAFGAHPLNSYSGYSNCADDLEQWLTHLWSYWQGSDYGTALGNSSFAGFQFWNTRNTTGKINLGGDYPDEIPAPPFIYNPAWRYELMDGLVKWTELNLRTLNANNYDYGKKIFMIGGSDAHGHFNYEVNASFDIFGDNDVSQNNSAFGKVSTYVYCPGGNTKNNVLYALRNGNSIVTDGPLVILGIDKNEDGDIRDSDDIIIGESTQLAEGEHPTFLIQWKSTEELGPIEYINIKRGEYNDCGHSWQSSKRIYIDSSNGLDGSIEYKDSAADPCTNYFYRVEAFTTEHPVSLPYYPYCSAYTNPIWVYSNLLASCVRVSGHLDELFDPGGGIRVRIPPGTTTIPSPTTTIPQPGDPIPIPDVVMTVKKWITLPHIGKSEVIDDYEYTVKNHVGFWVEYSTWETYVSGSWDVCVPVSPDTLYRVTPSKPGYIFDPPYLDFISDTSYTNLNFVGTYVGILPTTTTTTPSPTTTTPTTTSTTTTTAVCQCPGDGTPPTGCILGTVKDSAGNPLANKKVKLKRGTTLVNTVITDVNGCYWFINLTDGTYKVILKCCKICTALRQTRTITGGEHVNGVNFECE